MCVIAWCWRKHPDFPLAVIGNRDELHGRPAEPAHWWGDAPGVLAGRDAEAGGTWLGVTRGGRFAAVTNRHPAQRPPEAPSRGALTAGFLKTAIDVPAAAAGIAAGADLYAGFNLLIGDPGALAFVSNREADRSLAAGVYGMANGPLDERVPKVRRLTAGLDAWAHSHDEPDFDAWFEWLADDTPGEADNPMSAVFVRGGRYGTRASTIYVLRSDGEARFLERRFGPGGAMLGDESFDFRVRG